MSELLEELGELFGAFAMEDAEDPGDHLELDGFQFAFQVTGDRFVSRGSCHAYVNVDYLLLFKNSIATLPSYIL